MPARSRLPLALLPLAGLAVLAVVLGLAPPASELPPEPAPGPGAPGLDPALLTGPEPAPWEPPARPAAEPDGPAVVVRGRGWGHSVGMSQYGARAQAKAGRGYRDILAHYYPGTTVERHAAADRSVRVGLFRNRPVANPERLRVATAGRDGRVPDRPVEVQLGDATVAVPHGQVWALVAREGRLVLIDADDAVRAEAEGPARVSYGFLDGTPTLLRLPQLARAGAALSGTLQWGVVEVDVDADADRVLPTLVVPLELYLRGLAEMPSTWEPDALRAQAVAGRTYAVRMVLDGLKDDCACHLGTTPHDQAYAGWEKEGGRAGTRWRAAVDATAGEVALHEDELAWTYYSSSHGGRTEAAPDSWAYDEEQDLPYLVSVDDPWSLEPGNPMASWERRFPADEFARAVGLAELDEIAVMERTQGGSPSVLAVTGRDLAGNKVAYEFRGWRTGVAASDLKLHFRAELPSQQLTAFELRDAGD